MGGYDGYITIGTKLDTKDLEKELRQEEKDLERFEKEQSKLLEAKSKIQIDDSEIQKLKQELDKIDKKYREILHSEYKNEALQSEFDKAKQKYNELLHADYPGQALTDALYKKQDLEAKLSEESKRFQEQKNMLLIQQQQKYEEIQAKIVEENQKYNEQKKLLEDINAQIEENKADIDVTKENIGDIVKDIRQEQSTESINKNIQSIGGSISGVIKKVGRWALAMFGIRGVLGFISSSMSTLSQYNEQIGTDIQYIKFAIASSMQPLIERLIDLAYKLLAYTNYIAKAWFGVDLFSRATASNFNKATGSAKQLKKQLAGFDEMNILSDNQSGGGVNLPSTDLSKLNNIEIPEWVKWIADHKDEILNMLKLAGELFLAKKVLEWGGAILGLLKPSGALGMLGTTLGTLSLIAGGILITYLCAKQVWDDAQKLKKELDEINKKIDEHYDKQLGYYDEITDDEKRINQMLLDGTSKLSGQNEQLSNSQSFWSKILGLSKSELENVRQNEISNKKIYDSLIDQYNQGKMNNNQKDELKKKLENQITLNQKTSEELQKQGMYTGELDTITEDLQIQLYAVNNGIKYNGQETEGWKQKTEEVGNDLNAINNINFTPKDLQVNVKKSSWEKFVDAVNKFFGQEFHISFEGSSGGGHSSGGSHFAKGGIAIHPKLATGGVIINQAGRGVPIGSAIGGERGAEGVIPLTDSQQMALLGEAIGRYITINANIVNTMNGRVISREMKRINANNNFASNS